jgi:L-threonylcarbamoyladenylate synthase
MKYRHYAPKGDLTIIDGAEDKVVARINELVQSGLKAHKRVGVIGTDATINRYTGTSVKSAGNRQDEETVAKELYRILREFDDENMDLIYSESFDAGGIGAAIMNRLLKAAGHHVEKV